MFKKNRMTKGERAFSIINIIIMILLIIIVIYPLWYVVIYAFDDASDAATGGLTFFSRVPTLFNFKVILQNPSLYHGFLITFLRTVIGTVTSVFFTAMVAYPLSKQNLMGRKIFLALGTVTIVFSAGMIPMYFVIKSLGLIDSFWVYIIPALFSFYNCIIFMSFFSALPDSLEESASIDGANDFTIFLKIVIPLSTPVIATIALFNGVYHYNDYFSSVLYLNTKTDQLNTVQAFLYQLISTQNKYTMTQNMPATMNAASKTSPTSLQCAAMIIVSLPILFIYPFLQKYFVKGLLVGGVKG